MMRRGACPSLGVPMQTGDGLLVRLRPKHRELSPAALAGVAMASQRCGNGRIEVTARGNLQIRGLRRETVEPFRQAVSNLDTEWQEGVPVEVGALAGIDAAEMADPRPIADAIRARLAAAEAAVRGGPKASVLVDGGGVLPLDAIRADIRLRAVGPDRWRLTAGGTDADVDSPVESAAAALTSLATSRSRVPGHVEAEPVGRHRLRDDLFAVGLALPFGQISAEVLAELAAWTARPIRLAPGRAVLVLGVNPAEAAALQDGARRLGLIADPGDPRRAVAACPGCPDCAAGEIRARMLAEQAVAAAPALLDGSIGLHVSGCAKSCAHPAPATIGLIGVAGGCDVVLDGAAVARLPSSGALQGLALLAEKIAAERSHPGETAAQGLARMGPARVAGLLRGQAHV